MNQKIKLRFDVFVFALGSYKRTWGDPVTKGRAKPRGVRLSGGGRWVDLGRIQEMNKGRWGEKERVNK